MSDESIKPPTTPNKILNPSLDYVGNKIRVKFSGDCLKQEKITFNHRKIVKIYIVHEKCLNKQLPNAGKLFVWCSKINKTCLCGSV